MSAPVISIYNSDHSAVVSTWAVGEVKAQNSSDALVLNFWNNKGGTADVSDLKEATVTCLDSDGGNTAEMTTGKWMQVLVNTTASTDTSGNQVYTAIGGDTTQAVRAEGLTSSDGNIIKGTLNDGTSAATTNYSKATFKITVPVNATEGDHGFRIRLQGYYT